MSIDKILYYIGGIIIFLGIGILLGQHWQTLSYNTRILATLGSGIAAYIVGILLGREKETQSISAAFYLISVLAISMGIYVIFDHLGFDITKLGPKSVISAMLFSLTIFSYCIFRSNLFVLSSIFFGSCFFWSITSFLLIQNPSIDIFIKNFYDYRLLITGFVYILLGYSFTGHKHSSLSGLLYGLGILGFLGAAISLGGWKPHQNIIWELIFPVLAFGTLFFSVYLKSKTFLVFGTLFLILYILKISSEYFAESLGWPLVLVISGLGIMFISYLSIKLKRKYLSV